MRVQLGGKGEHIPEIALPDPTLADGSAPVALPMENGQVFTPVDYISLGYTHYEVWCVGAVGGRGGNAGITVSWPFVVTKERVPDNVWANYRAWDIAQYRDWARNPKYPIVKIDVWNPATSRYELREVDILEYRNPTHIVDVITFHDPFLDEGPSDLHYRDPFLLSSVPIVGGGGGGGGLHVTSGRLDELPEAVPVAVGKAGADAPVGQVNTNGLWEAPTAGNYNNPDAPGSQEPIFLWSHRYPSPRPKFNLPQAGQDGGASSFGDVCKASGGKGGGPAVIFGADGRRYFAGYGGEGGAGGRTAAGGGAPGADKPQSTGQDGSWDPNTGIGKGGGGGRGGMDKIDTSDVWMAGETLIVDGVWYAMAWHAEKQATAGGQGSFSYADTKVYGNRQDKGAYYRSHRQYSLSTGLIVAERLVPSQGLILPGTGGGAKLPGKRYFGSRAVGFNPNGAVLIRLFTVN